MSRLIDVHAHYVPDFYRQALIDSGNSTPDGSPVPAWDEETHLARLGELRLDAAVLSLSSPGVSGLPDPAAMARRVNERGHEIARRHPEAFAYLACLPLPDVPASCAEAARALTDGGAAGIGLLTSYDGTYLGAPELEPLLETLDAHAATVVIHPTSPRGAEHLTCGRPSPVIEYLFETTRTVTDLLLAGAPAQEGVDGSALDGPGADERHFHDDVVEAAGLEPGEGAHLRPRLHLEDADRVRGAQQPVDRGVLLGKGVQPPGPAGPGAARIGLRELAGFGGGFAHDGGIISGLAERRR